MSLSLRFFNNKAPVLGKTFEGSVSKLLQTADLSGHVRVVITETPKKDDMQNLIKVLRNTSQIKMLCLAQTKDLPDESHEALVQGLGTLSLSHLFLDGTKLSSRIEHETAGLLLVIQEATKVPGLVHLAAKSHFPSHSPADYHPLSEQTASFIGNAIARSSGLITVDLKPFYLKAKALEQFILPLQTLSRPCPMIKFNNIAVTARDIHSLLDQARQTQDKKAGDNQGEVHTLFASQRAVGFKN